MGRGRAPCCEKVGLNKGSWTPEEDFRLISYIQKHGHGNWRALPKKAGLLRCGKSCRLRWINYLRPDVKRGNFTKEEEETIIKLHGLLGNKWSKIASCLPGRTDNEIKNVWNTHLKKRLSEHKDDCRDQTETTSDGDRHPNQETNQVEIIPPQPHTTDADSEARSGCSSSPSSSLLAVNSSADKEEIPEIDIELEFWSIIEGMDTGFYSKESETLGVREDTTCVMDGRDEQSRGWLEYLERELGLWESK